MIETRRSFLGQVIGTILATRADHLAIPRGAAETLTERRKDEIMDEMWSLPEEVLAKYRVFHVLEGSGEILATPICRVERDSMQIVLHSEAWVARQTMFLGQAGILDRYGREIVRFIPKWNGRYHDSYPAPVDCHVNMEVTIDRPCWTMPRGD